MGQTKNATLFKFNKVRPLRKGIFDLHKHSDANIKELISYSLCSRDIRNGNG